MKLTCKSICFRVLDKLLCLDWIVIKKKGIRDFLPTAYYFKVAVYGVVAIIVFIFVLNFYLWKHSIVIIIIIDMMIHIILILYYWEIQLYKLGGENFAAGFRRDS